MKPTGATKKYWGILAGLLSVYALTSLGPLLPAAPQGVQEGSIIAAARSLTPADIPALLGKAEAGDGRSQLILSEAYEGGFGVKRNVWESAKWGRKAYEQGFTKRWAHRAVELGLAEGHLYLAQLARDPDEIIAEFQRAVELAPSFPDGRYAQIGYPAGKKALKQYEGCLKKSTNKQSSCLTQLAQKLQTDLASKKDWPSYKRELVIVALLTNDRLGQHEDYDKLRARFLAYGGAISLESSLGEVSLRDYFDAMYQYFQRLGAEYKPDADWALRGYGRESGNGGTNWAAVVTQALQTYNRGVAEGQQATAQAVAVAKANQKQEQRQREQANANAVAQLQAAEQQRQQTYDNTVAQQRAAQRRKVLVDRTACIRVEVKRSKQCANEDDGVAAIFESSCTIPVTIKACLQRGDGTWSCAMDDGPRLASLFVCSGTGRYWIFAAEGTYQENLGKVFPEPR